MPVQTQLQQRRGTAASWTSTNPTLAAGEIGFETDTGKFKIGNGSTAWAALAYSAGATAVTYLFNATSGQTTFSGADANGLTLAYTVGAEQVYLNGVLQVRGSDYTATNGTSIVLTSGALTSDVLNVIAYSAMTITDTYTQAQADAKFVQQTNNFFAGKNKIINGDFAINQRAFTSNTITGLYNFDRFFQSNVGGTTTVTPQTFTLGAAPVAGYEGKNFLQCDVTGQSAAGDFAYVQQRIESVRTFADQTVTISFWAKATSGTPSVAVSLNQGFGTGGSPSSTVATAFGKTAISTSWTRYSFTAALPSIAGKTIGTNNNDHIRVIIWFSAGSTFNSETTSLGTQTNTFQIWGVQAEYGSQMTPFQTASGGSPQAELAMCQRYYIRTTSTGTDSNHGIGLANSTTTAYIHANIAEMRVIPTSVDYANLNVSDSVNNFTFSGLSINSANSTPRLAFLIATGASGMTQFRPLFMRNNNNTSGYIGFSAEL